jgi:small subunit ribosomal protein S6
VNDYELTLIFRADIDDEARTELLERVTGWLPLAKDGKEPVIKSWGRRQLAYPIRKQTDGYYTLIEAALDPTGISEMERNILYVENILRHMVVRKEA